MTVLQSSDDKFDMPVLLRYQHTHQMVRSSTCIHIIFFAAKVAEQELCISAASAGMPTAVTRIADQVCSAQSALCSPLRCLYTCSICQPSTFTQACHLKGIARMCLSASAFWMASNANLHR